MTTSSHAVVLGAGLAGTLAAAALAAHVDTVTLVEADRLPEGPQPRKGVPQARHAHLLWSGGARAMESLLPGTLDSLRQAGAHQIGLPADLVAYTAQGWVRRFDAMQFLITCSRDLLDWAVRRQLVTAYPDTRIRQGVRVLELVGDRNQVSGVRVASDAGDETIEADLVVDATGRGSRAPHWLSALGLPQVREEVVDSGLAYATRIFVAPTQAQHRFPLVNVQADPTSGTPGRTATILPIEDGKWLVTLSGTRGGHPPSDAQAFADFAANHMRDPIVGQLIAGAQPLTDVEYTNSGGNRRRFFEKLRVWPRGFLVIGDAVATYNPVYGQGMSVAAQGALQLHQAIRGSRLPNLDTRAVQKAICRTGDTPWLVATGQDIQYPGAVGKPQPRAAKLAQAYFERFIRTAAANPAAAARLYEAFTLSGPMSRLFTPAAVLSVIRGPSLPALDAAPLTADEIARAGIASAPPSAPAPPHQSKPGVPR
jgi:2-polyprenyl-6-methoxyphenol hydroxylase-like FAD-dependent oxidoreductase